MLDLVGDSIHKTVALTYIVSKCKSSVLYLVNTCKSSVLHLVSKCKSCFSNVLLFFIQAYGSDVHVSLQKICEQMEIKMTELVRMHNPSRHGHMVDHTVDDQS